MTYGISIIPLKKSSITDGQIRNCLVEKLDAKNFKVKHINFHRHAVEGAFVRCDVHIDLVKVAKIHADFVFTFCLALSCPV